MGVIMWGPLPGGWLSGKYRHGREPPPGSRAARYRDPGNPLAGRLDVTRAGNQRKLDLIEGLNEVAEEAGLALSHMSMAFALAHPSVASAIIGPRTTQQFDELLRGADVRLDADTLDAIDRILEPGSTIE